MSDAVLILIAEGLAFPAPQFDGLTVIPCAAGELDAATKKAWHTTGSEWFGALRASMIPSGFAEGLLGLVRRSPGQGIVVPLPPAPGMPDLWGRLPPEVAYLVPQPMQSAALLSRRPTGGGTDPGPFWANGQWSIERLERSPAGMLVPSELPPLVPRAPRTPKSWPAMLEEMTIPWAKASLTPTRRTALLAGLWLLQDELDRSHSHSQQIEGADGHYGDYWHAIMHRREPDYGNSQYWFRRVGRHPVQARLAEELAAGRFDPVPEAWRGRLARGGWDSLAFVDLCEAAEDSPEFDAFARRIQWCEMLHLLCETAGKG